MDVGPDERVLLIFGGSQAVRRFNAAVADALLRLVERVTVIHVTGDDGYATALAGSRGAARRRPRPLPAVPVPARRDARRAGRRGPRRRAGGIVHPGRGDRPRSADGRRPVPARGGAPAGERGVAGRGRRGAARRGRGLRRRRAARRCARSSTIPSRTPGCPRRHGRSAGPVRPTPSRRWSAPRPRAQPFPDAAEIDRLARGAAA